MDNKDFKKSIRQIRDIKMTETESQKIFNSVMGSHKVLFFNKFSFTTFFSYNYRMAFIIALLILTLAGGSAASAAEGALPGDILYPIKVRVTEPIRDSFARTSEELAELQIIKTERRLEEAEILSVEGRLDDKKGKQISDLLYIHAKTFSRELDNIEDADDIKVSYEAGLNAHAKVLETIDKKSENIARAAREATKNIEKQNKQVKKYSQNREVVKNLIQDTHITLEKIDQKVNKVALDTQATTSIKTIKESIIDDARATLDEANSYFKDADIKDDAGNKDEAYTSRLNSVRSAKEAKILLDASLRVEDRINKNESKKGKSKNKSVVELSREKKESKKGDK